MPTLRDALAAFGAEADAGRIVNRRDSTDERTVYIAEFSQARRNVLKTHLRAAIVRAHTLAFGEPPADVLDVEITPFLPTLPDHAFEAELAQNGRKADADKARSNARLFVSTVTGQDASVNRRAIVLDAALPEWRPLLGALEAAVDPDGPRKGGWRSLSGALLRLQDLAVARGLSSPRALPDDLDAVMAWGEQAGFKRAAVHHMLSALRRARALLADPTIPGCYQAMAKGGIGIRGLRDYAERLAAKGFTGDVLNAPIMDLVGCLAPPLHGILTTYVAEGKARNLSPSWVEHVESMASWLVASAIRLGVDPADQSFLLNLWEVTREVEVAGDAAYTDALDAMLGFDAGGVTVEQRPLIRLMLDATAPQSYANSPLRLANRLHEADAVPVYTQKLQDLLLAAYTATVETVGRRMLNPPVAPGLSKEADEARKQALHARRGRLAEVYKALCAHVTGYNAPRVLQGGKRTEAMQATWSQAMCLGGPYLRNLALEARAEMRTWEREQLATEAAKVENAAKVGKTYTPRTPLESRKGQGLVAAYDQALRRYILFVTVLDDGMRVKNYAGALANEHFVPTVERDERGRWVGFRRVETRFRGLDDHSVSAKRDQSADGGENIRPPHVLTPAFVDHALLFDYWTETRPRELVRAGLLDSVRDFDPDRDDFAMFVTPRPSAALRAAGTTGAWKGQMTTDMLSEIWGRALHEICRQVLHRALPDFADPRLAADFRGLFSMHISRSMIASYLGGVRGEWDRACTLTNDAEDTLKEEYARVATITTNAMGVAGVENPRWFDAVVTRAFALNQHDDWAAFWDAFDPLRPEAALERFTKPAAKLTRWARSA